MMEKKKKKWYKSKTLWVNLISLIAIVLQIKTGREVLDPAIQASLLSAVNLFLRMITKEELV